MGIGIDAIGSGTILERVLDACATLAAAARRHDGLIPSLLARDGAPLHVLPPPIPGQRQGDRSFPGSNLQHDHPTLHTMLGLAAAVGRDDLREAAERYLATFAARCTATPTGLFPWGEHSYWDLLDQRPGNSYRLAGHAVEATHDHLRQAPGWLWDRLWALDADAVVRFAHGLAGHWKSEGPEYGRHAMLLRSDRYPAGDRRSCDFARHGGFYVFDWSYAHARRPDPVLRAHIVRMADYWWERRHPTGMLRCEGRTPPGDAHRHDSLAMHQTLSTALSFLEASDLLDAGEPAIAATLRTRGRTYLDGYLAAPHEPERRLFLNLLCPDGERRHQAIWGSRYGEPAVGCWGVLLIQAARLTGDERPRRMAAAMAEALLATPFPDDVHVPAADMGSALELLAGLIEDDDRERWLQPGLALAGEAMARYLDAPLPRAASGVGHYESQLQPGHLLHGLARVALAAEGRTELELDASLR